MLPSVVDPLFCHFGGQPLTHPQFNSVLCKACCALGIGLLSIHHSFRIGEFTLASSKGQLEPVVGGRKVRSLLSVIFVYTIFVVSFKDIAGPHTRVWIVGSSVVKHAFARDRSSFEGSQLDLNRQAASVWWPWRKSLRWCHVSGLIRTLLSYEEAPDLLVIHVGGNDLGQVPLGNLHLNILTILDTSRFLIRFILCCPIPLFTQVTLASWGQSFKVIYNYVHLICLIK